MIATFACPHCAVACPTRPLLVGRALRCTACKKAFRLRADGTAEADEQPVPQPAAAPVPVSEASPLPPESVDTKKSRYDSLASAAQAALAAALDAPSASDRTPKTKPAIEAISPVVLSGSGEREYRRKLYWFLGVFTVVAALISIACLFWGWNS